MIKAGEIDYATFVQLPEADRMLCQQAYILTPNALDTLDVMQWEWGIVKELQAMFSSDITYMDILTIAKMEAQGLNDKSLARTVVMAFNAISEQVDKINENEKAAFSSAPSAKEKLAAERVGGFDSFGTYPQTYELCKVLNMSYADVQRLPYHEGFVALAYFERLKRYRDEYNELMKNKDD